ncbi:serine/threonine-protein kinase fray2-like [Ruditapes philippinarum]|uniref:serine/threonine-protein kinase fray2-like n=1 Tax=Ruditapes philippinarum TaxID=129788 RepID=UPI00295BB523|nr:serine/threonine-protein kinase fray2-like [Ruditapes philippinarum]
MADINQCTSRTLASNSGISSELASRIVNFRKLNGRVQSFSELWNVDGMTRAFMKTLRSNFLIKDAASSGLENINNNSFRTPKKKEKKNKIKCKETSTVNNKTFSNVNSRVLESLPLLSDSHGADDTDSDNLFTVYTPIAVQSSASRGKIITVYQVASPDKMKSPEIIKSVLPRHNRKESKNQSKNQAKQQTGPKRTTGQNREVKTPSPRKNKDNGLTHSKKKSIQKWLKDSSTESSKEISPYTGNNKRSKSRDQYNRNQSCSRSRSGSRSRLLRKSCGAKKKIKHFKPHHGHTSELKNKGNAHTENPDGPLTWLDLESSFEKGNEKQNFEASRRYDRCKKSSSRAVEPNPLRSEREEGNHHIQHPCSSSSVKQKVKITESSKDLNRRSITRRSLWKNKRRSRSPYDYHQHQYRRHRSKSRDRDRSRDRKHRPASSPEANDNCTIL